MDQRSSFLIAAVACSVVAAGFALSIPELQHWFLLPVLACGIIAGTEAASWSLGKYSLLDPAGLIGLFGIHLFFLAPMLHMTRDWWMIEIPISEHPLDWRPWLGLVAGLNAAGLVVYRLSRYWAERHLPSGTTSIWRIDPQRFWPRVLLLLAATGILQAAVYAKFGGIAGYIHTILDLQDAEAVQGMGWILTLCETFPAFAIMAWAVAARSQPWLRSWAAIAAMLVCFFAIQLLFGGLRGSRGNTIWGLVGAIGIVHLFVRPISRRMLAAGAVTGLIFLYFYGFIKGAGVEGLEAIYDSTSREEIARKTGRNMDMVLLGDLGRSDVQAFLVYRLSQGDNSFHYALGRSYFGAVASLVPSALWRDKPPTKVKEGTDAQWGEGAYESFGVRSSRQYGIAGEALLNFGIWSIPLAFAVLGFATAVVRRFMSRLVEGDARNFVVPLLSLSCVLLLVMDSENILLFLLKGVLIPLIALRAFAHVERDQASPVEVHG